MGTSSMTTTSTVAGSRWLKRRRAAVDALGPALGAGPGLAPDPGGQGDPGPDQGPSPGPAPGGGTPSPGLGPVLRRETPSRGPSQGLDLAPSRGKDPSRDPDPNPRERIPSPAPAQDPRERA